ncbi:MAG TPA: hypothetical protein VKG63_19115 [Steroidobacteraceae bacterium]|nr:hypothetical protein [Steroidobacteraceae bacterium]
MNTQTQARSRTEIVALVWLDALAGNVCTPEEFLNAVHEQARDDSDELWEVLSLLDQYYRRGKIHVELFHTLKSHLESSALHVETEARAPTAALRTDVPRTDGPRTDGPRTDVPRTDVPRPDVPPPSRRARKSTGVRTAAAFVLFAVLAAGGYLAVTKYDSPARLVAPATAPATLVAAHQESPPPATADSSNVAPPPPTPSPTPEAVPAPPSANATPTRTGNAGPVRIEMAADTVDVKPTEPAARVKVRRRGNLHADASFTWWTESGTAMPGRDFTPVLPGVEHIAEGSGSITLNIPVLSTPHGKSKSFFVVIDRSDAGGGALGARNLTMVTIQPSDEAGVPTDLNLRIQAGGLPGR